MAVLAVGTKVKTCDGYEGTVTHVRSEEEDRNVTLGFLYRVKIEGESFILDWGYWHDELEAVPVNEYLPGQGELHKCEGCGLEFYNLKNHMRESHGVM